jgi:transcriptional regulator with XRE-family HTH domain
MTELQAEIRRARIEQGRSLRDLAEEAGISHHSVHVLETRERPTLVTLQRVAAALGRKLVMVPLEGDGW